MLNKKLLDGKPTEEVMNIIRNISYDQARKMQDADPSLPFITVLELIERRHFEEFWSGQPSSDWLCDGLKP